MAVKGAATLNKLLIAIVVIALLGGIGFVVYQEKQKADFIAVQEAKVQAELVEKRQAEASKRAEIFENFLNSFLQIVAKEAKEYKHGRAVLVGLILPENLRNADYITENYTLGEATVMSLRLQMDKIMGIFDDADNQFDSIISNWPEEDTREIREGWDQVKQNHTQLYVEYFDSEQAILSGVLKLLEFYDAHKTQIGYDEVSGQLTFADPSVEGQADDIKLDLEALMELQEEMLAKHNIKADEPATESVTSEQPSEQ
ncbi:MAG: hypothetical protein KTR28_01630 [Micavibrio sp.]|nr:hypothetical protein [Micavibrio sp.]